MGLIVGRPRLHFRELGPIGTRQDDDSPLRNSFADIFFAIGFDEVVFNLGKNGQAVSMDARVLEQPALPKGKGNQKVVGRASRMIRS